MAFDKSYISWFVFTGWFRILLKEKINLKIQKITH
jgi:hypothetical protein